MPLSFDMSPSDDDITLRFDVGSQLLRIFNTHTASIVAERALEATDEVVVTGSERAERFRIQFDAAFWLPKGIRFDAGLGADDLVVESGAFESVAYHLSGADSGAMSTADAGNVAAISFTGLEQLTDYSTAADRSVSDDTGLGTTIGLGDDGNAANGVTAVDSAGTQGFTSLQFSNPLSSLTIDAGEGDDTVRIGTLDTGIPPALFILGGGGNDTLVGADQSNTWLITGPDSGALNGATFAEFENLTGGSGDDRFVFAGGTISGTIDGGGGTNTFDYSSVSSPVTINLASGTASGVGGLVAITAFVGGGGSDTLVGPDAGAQWRIAGKDSGTIGLTAFASIENLIGGGGDDLFEFDALGSVTGGVDGGQGNDAIQGPDADAAFAVSAPDAGTVNGSAFMNVENLFGGIRDDEFAYAFGAFLSGAAAGGAGLDRLRAGNDRNTWKLLTAGGTLNGRTFTGFETLEGGGGEDTLVGPSANTAWTVDGPGSGSVAGITFTGFEFLEGAADNQDTFVFTGAGGVSGGIEGGAGGFDIVELAGGTYTALVHEAYGPDSGLITYGDSTLRYSGLEPVLSSGATDITLTYSDSAETIEISDEAAAGDKKMQVKGDGAETFNITNADAVTKLTIVTKGGADKITIKSVDSTFAGNIVIQAGDDDDTIDIQTDIGTGTVTAEGGKGDDTYVFGASFGDVAIVENADEGVDKIDFTGHAGTLTVKADKTEITSSIAGNKLTQGTEVAEEIDVKLTTALDQQTDKLIGAVNDLKAFIDKLNSGVGAVSALTNQLPLIGGAISGGLDDIVNFTKSAEEFANNVVAKITAFEADVTPTLGELVALIDGIAVLPAGFTTFSFDASTDYRGKDTAKAVSPAASGQLELILDIDFLAEATKTIELDLGQDALDFGIAIDADIKLDGKLEGDFKFGLSTDVVPSAFLIPGSSVKASVDATATLDAASVNLGFLEAKITTGKAEFDGSVTVTLDDPDLDGSVTLSELTTKSVDDLTTVATASTFSASATATVDAGVKIGVTPLANATFSMSLPGGSIFGTGSEPAVPTVKFETTDGGGLTNLLDFSNIGPNEVAGMLGQVLDTFTLLAGSKLLEAEIPFTGTTLGDVLDFATNFRTRVLDPLFESGSLLRPDNDGDGAADFKFSSIQDLVGELATKLSLPGLTSGYDPLTKELTFTIEFARGVAFGEADVATTQAGGTGKNEIQTVTVNAVSDIPGTADDGLADTFRLAFPDAKGALEFTAPIAFNADAATVDAKLEALKGINLGDGASNNVKVTKSGSVYTIEFQNALKEKNVEQLQSDASELAGVYPLTFSLVDLGDLGGIDTSSTFSMAAALKAGLTLGIDLDPSTVIEITPPVFDPDTDEMVIGAQKTEGSNKVQVITVHNATFGTYQLIYDGPTAGTGDVALTGDIQWDASADAVDDALDALVGGVDANVSVVKTTSGNDSIYTITFADAKTPEKVLAADFSKLRGASDGILSASGQFKFNLFNDAITIDDPDGGDPLTGLSDAKTQLDGLVTIDVARNTTFTSLSDLASAIQTTVDAQLIANGFTLGFLDTGTISKDATFTASSTPFTKLGNDLAYKIFAGGKEISGRLRAYDVLDGSAGGQLDGTELSATVVESKLISALDKSIDTTLKNAGLGSISVQVSDSVDDGKLEIKALGGDVRLVFDSPVKVNAGGGRISLDAPDTTLSIFDLEPATPRGRDLQIMADFANTAYQELGILSAPTSFDGKIQDDVEFTLNVDGKNVTVTMLDSVTGDNTGLIGADNKDTKGLVGDLNKAIDDALSGKGLATDLVEAQLVDDDGNRIKLVGKQGVSKLSIDVPDTFGGGVDPNGAITELGFVSGEGGTQKAKAAEFFLDNVFLKADFALNADPIKATAAFGFLEVTADGKGSLTATADFKVKDPIDGDSRVTIPVLTKALQDGKFIFKDADKGDADPGPGIAPKTGIIEGTVSSLLDFDLKIHPSGALSGLSSALEAEVHVDAGTADWLTTPPTLNVTVDGPDFASVFSKFDDLSFDDILAGLRLVVDFLRDLDGSKDGSAIAGALDFKLPLIDRSVADLIDLAGEFSDRLDAAEEAGASSIQALEQVIRNQFGIPSSVPNILSFDSATGDVVFNFQFLRSINLSRPFNLDLAGVAGLPSWATSLVGASASGNLGVNASLDLAFVLGFDVETLSFYLVTDDTGTPGTTEGTRLTASASATGTNLDFSAQIGPFGLFVTDGSASLNGSFAVKLLNDDDKLYLASFNGGPASEIGELPGAVNVAISGTGNVSLPLFVGTEDLQIPLGSPSNILGVSINFNDLITPGGPTGITVTLPDVDFNSIQLPSLFALLANPSFVVDGLDRALGTFEDALRGQILGIDLPLIGDLLSENPAANFIADFRDEFLTPLANTLRQNNLNLDGLLDSLRNVIFNVFHTQLGILQDIDDPGTTPELADILIRFVDDTGDPFTDGSGNPLTLFNAKGLQIDFDLGDNYSFTTGEIDFDLGIPALGLSGRLTPTVTIDWGMHFGFGVHESLGFYFAADHNPEIDLTVAVTFTDGAFIDPDPLGTPAGIDGRLLFLGLHMTDGIDLNGVGGVQQHATDPVADEFTKLFIQGTVNIVEPSGDGRLTFPELIRGPLKDIFQPTLTGGAFLRLHAEVDFSTLGSGLANVLPSISTNILAQFSFNATPATGFVISAPELALLDITLDVGSFISDFAGPILNTIGDILDPFEWLIGPDGFLNMRIPLLSDLLGKKITGADLIELFDPVHGPAVKALLGFLETLVFLTNLVQDATAAAESGNLALNFGDLVLFDGAGGINFSTIPGFVPLAVPGLGGDLRSLKNFNGANLAGLGTAPSLPSGGAAGRFVSGATTSTGDFQIFFRLFEPETIFKLILGQPDVTLVEVELPEFGFSFYYRQLIPIIGPLVGTFAGGISGKLDFGFGYDTRGLQTFLKTFNPIDLLDGFFINDLDPVTKIDRPEGTIQATIAVGAAISLALVTAGVEGGIDFNVDFNLADLDNDGKIRFEELAANLIENSFNPLAIFDVHGLVQFFLRAYVEINLFITTITFDFEFVRLTLFEFDIDFNRPPILATLSGDTLTLNIGPNAASRLNGNVSDIAETIHVEMDGSDVIVWSDELGRSKLTAGLTPFSGVTKIIADGGLGNDVIDLSGVSSAIKAEIRGGDGDDKITGGAGADMLFGDAGDDIILGGKGNDEIYGGLGVDKLKGEDDEDKLFGEEGNDELEGGPGGDTLDGGSGDDKFTGGDGNDVIKLFNFGSVETIVADGLGTGVLDFTDFASDNLTYFLKDGKIQIGYGLKTGEAGDDIGDFTSQVLVGDIAEIDEIKGGDLVDTFHVFQTDADGIKLDGQKGNDRYFVYVGSPTIDVTINETGDAWNEDAITIVGGAGDDEIKLTNSEITLAVNETVTYTAPAAGANLLQIKIKGNDGDDTINVESTAETVPVRVEGGAHDDVVIVGGSAKVDGIKQTFYPGVNTPFGLGPLVLVGGGGHDVVIVDDSGDDSKNFGNVNAFVENRQGSTGPTPVEVGIVSGLDMTMKMESGTVDGRIEYEGFETVEVKLGTKDDAFTIGGDFNLAKGVGGGKAEAHLLTTTELPQTRLSESPGDTSKLGIVKMVDTINGLTVVDAGDGADTVNIIDTQKLDDAPLNTKLGLLSWGTTTPGVKETTSEVQTVTADLDAHDTGFFTLKYRYNETAPIEFGSSAAVVDKALQDLVLIGGSGGKDNVDVAYDAGSGKYTITFKGDLKEQDVEQITARVVPLLVDGGDGIDHLNLQAVNQTTVVRGGGDGDFFDINVDVKGFSNDGGTLKGPVDPPALKINGVNAEVTLDGGDGGDDYDVHLIGGTTHSRIHVFDTGATGNDHLTVFGIDSELKADWDLFLLRASSHTAGLAFIAHINKDADADPTNDPFERVDYDKRLETIVIDEGKGDDSLYADGTRASITVLAGEGDDFAQVGQLFKTRRTPDLANVFEEDIFTTIETTKGWLSDGISEPMTINFSDGKDTAIVFHNKAVLTLNGGKDDDTFIIQAFALVGSEDSGRKLTDLSGDAGADTIQYAVNAPVQINGGDGLDTVIIIGTEFGEDFVVTRDGVFGAGLNVNFINIENLEIDAAEGDDRFFILSTDSKIVTRVVGNLGTDFFFVQGPTPGNGVISNDLLGHSGIITHNVTSSVVDSIFEGLKVIGISSNVADNDEPAIRITETDGFSRVVEGSTPGFNNDEGDWDSYSIVLTRPPRDDGSDPDFEQVTISLDPPTGLMFLDAGFNPILDGEGNPDGIQLFFNSTNWYTPQIVRFAVDPAATVEEYLTDIQHGIVANDDFSGGQVDTATNFFGSDPNDDDDDFGFLTDMDVTFPTGTGLGTDAFPQGLRGLFVVITGSASNPEVAGQIRMILENDAHTLKVQSPWTLAPGQTDLVALPSDAEYQITYFDDVNIPNVRVEVYNFDKNDIVVDQLDGLGGPGIQTGGSTQVAEDDSKPGGADTDILHVRLSKAPGAEVTVDLLSTLYGSVNVGTDGQLRFFDGADKEITFLKFTTDTWDDYQTVKVVGFDDGAVEGFHKVDLALKASGGGYDGLTRTFTTDVADNEYPGVRIIESDGSTDVIEFTDDHFGEGAGVAEAAGFLKHAQDSYQVLLSQAPGLGETVTVNIVAEPTRTSRYEIRSFIEQVEVSIDGGASWGFNKSLTFTSGDWNAPKTVLVRAIDDPRVDGGDAQVFAPTLDQLNAIQGPLFITGGPFTNRTGLLERDPIMLPYETNIRPDALGSVLDANEGGVSNDPPADITINLNSLADPDVANFLNLVDFLRDGTDDDNVLSLNDLKAEDFVDLTIEITQGPAKNKVRIITAADNAGDSDPATWFLNINQKWFSPFTQNADVPTNKSEFTLYETNPNLLVNEADQADRLIASDADNVNSYDDAWYAANIFKENQFGIGKLFLDESTAYTGVPFNQYRLVGLGMGPDRTIGGALQPGGITIQGMEQLEITLGIGNNKFTIEDTEPGTQVTLNTGRGDDVVHVKTISGHTFVNLGAGNDALTITSDAQKLDELLGLLTVSGDVPAVQTVTLVNGSPVQDGGLVAAANEIQRITVEATGGTFTLSLGGKTTSALAYDISAAKLDEALEDLVMKAFATTGKDDITVTKAGNIYRVAFTDELAGKNIDLLAANDLGLTNGKGTLDTLIIDDSKYDLNTVGVLTSSSVTGLSTKQVNEIQTIVVDATEGTFQLSFGGKNTGDLAYNISAAKLDEALEQLDTIGLGNVAVTQNDDVYVVRFQGDLSNTNVDTLGFVNNLKSTTELPGGDLTTGAGSVTISTRVNGTGDQKDDPGLNEMQMLTVNATGGTFMLSLLNGFEGLGPSKIVTDPIPYDASADVVQDALQFKIAELFPKETDPKFDVIVSKYGNVYFIGFQGRMRMINEGSGVDMLEVDTAALTGTAAIATRMDGINYYGFEDIDIALGTKNDVLSIQGTTAGSKGFYDDKGINKGIARTDIALGTGDEQVFTSSNADLDFGSATATFDFLTGNLDDVNGALNLDFGDGRHRLMISDEGTSVGDNDDKIDDKDNTSDDTAIVITEALSEGGAKDRQLDTKAEIWITGLAGRPDLGFPEGGISYKVALTGNLFDGVVYWTGAGADEISIDATHTRAGARTTTLLNTGLGDDTVTVDLDNAGDDGFFSLHTSGGETSDNPGAYAPITGSDDDTVDASASSLPLVIFGGWGDDTVTGGTNKDVIFGDFGRVQYIDPTDPSKILAVHGFGGRGDRISSDEIVPGWIFSRDLTLGGVDILQGNADEDILIGGTGGNSIGDYIDGDTGDDLIFGDAVQLMNRAYPTPDITNPRFQALLGSVIYSRTDFTAAQMGAPVPTADTSGAALIDGKARDYRNQDGKVPYWATYEIKNLYHSAAIEALGGKAGGFGDDYIAGGADDDMIFGQLGSDIIQGDGSIESAIGIGNVLVGAGRTGTKADVQLTPHLTAKDVAALVLVPSFEAATDGDDYIEGNGGADTIFGNLGQDDIVGGSSSLFSLKNADQRPDTGDMIFGGSGERAGRNAEVDGKDAIFGDRYGRDADAIAGDNANIYRLVGTEGSAKAGFLGFNFDDAYKGEQLVPRAIELLDYTPGGVDYKASAKDDIGDADEIHGESGNDLIYGMKGSDFMFGDSEDDDIVGGYGNDWISGGTGQDGVIGDDGRHFTSRNGTAEPLNGVMVATTQSFISTPGKIQQADIYVTGELNKAVDLTPFSQDPDWAGTDDEFAGASKHTSDDTIYGGLGDDFLHGGTGDDAISGAEALPDFFARPVNPGNVLGYGQFKAGEFASYDEFDPLRKIVPFFLNFDPGEGVSRTDATWGEVFDDGKDRIFGDNGNDWLVGGTGRDSIYGGWGNDLLNADDNHDSTASTADPTANNIPDTHPSYEDRAYGGAGRDVLIGNTGGDRLIDWVGEFNSYLVPFAPFGMATVSRTLQPQLAEFLYALSAADGADPTRDTDTGADPLRNGEPFGELGLVRQQDFAWQAQTGAPDDPQAGNIPGGKRDVLRSASFDGPNATGFFADSGVWKVTGGALEVQAASQGSDAVSVFHVGDALPGYFEVQASVLAGKPTGGWKANSYIIFDYQNEQDFKFVGLDVSNSKLVMGHRDASGWHVDKQAAVPGGVKADKYYNLLLAVNGVVATLVVDNKNVITQTYQARIVDGYSYGLNWGMVGVGSDNSRGKFDNIAVQVLPPQLTLSETESFDDGAADRFVGETTGIWQVQVAGGNGRYVGAPSAGAAEAYSLADLGLVAGLETGSYLELATRISTQALGGVIFDQYDSANYKFAAIDAASGNVVIGHRSAKGGWTIDASVAKGIQAGTDYDLTVAVKGSTVSVYLNGQVVLGHAFNAVAVDGAFGLLTRAGSSSFDSVGIKTDDPAFESPETPLMAASSSSSQTAIAPLSPDRLAPITDEAIARLTRILGLDSGAVASLRSISIAVSDLPGLLLGTEDDGAIVIDSDAAGLGWFVDATPADDAEFRRVGDDGRSATPNSAAYGQYDLLSAIMHEFGHAAGLAHGDHGFMQPTLTAGLRTAPSAGEIVVFDEVQNEFVSVEDARLTGHIVGLIGSGLTESGDGEDWIVRGLLEVEEADAGNGIALSTEPSADAGGGPSASNGDGHASTSSLVDWKAKFSGLGSGLKSGLQG